ncbi:hypothetical protein P4O66_017077 [Electrophorus voltai]|uniref:Uncharacterized protein n=1 Tax=Electrophorus voltai TaxID=2609070 RepID=A0AAD8YWB5_9TELE|nr:hypothetical protein P4O66_017077 [Electrophorus voltai]
MMMVGRRISTTGVPEVIKKRTTSLPGTTTLPWSTVTWVSPGLTTTNWMEEFVTNTSIPEAPTATSISTRTLRTATRASTQDPSMTTSVTTQPSDITYVIATSLTTEEPPRRTKEQQPWKHTIGTTKRASTVDTSARSSMASLTPEMENETHTTAVSSRSTTPSPKTTVWEPLGNSGPPPRRTFAATTAKRTLTLTTTIPRSSIEAATVATARPDQASKVTRLTWLHRRLKKKSKMGLRRAQRKPRG